MNLYDFASCAHSKFLLKLDDSSYCTRCGAMRVRFDGAWVLPSLIQSAISNSLSAVEVTMDPPPTESDNKVPEDPRRLCAGCRGEAYMCGTCDETLSTFTPRK